MTVPPIQTGIDAYMKRSIAQAKVEAIPDQTYAGSAISPKPVVKLGSSTLTEGIDYTLSCKANTAAGKATITIAGKGGYFRSLTAAFNIVQASLANASISVSTQTYSGAACKPSSTVKLGSKSLKVGSDYTVAYKNNAKVGMATATITGKGNYKGTKSVTFKINARNLSDAIITGLSAKGNANYKAAGKTVTVKVRVK